MSQTLPTPRPEIAALPRVVHGAVKDAELALLEEAGIAPEHVLDFSVNSNPLGPAPGVLEALAAIDVSRYPDDDATALRGALSARFGVPARQVLVGNGSAELIWLVCLAYVRAGDPVAIFGPTFGEYARAARIAGGHDVSFDTSPATAFALPRAEATVWLQSVAPRLVFLCNPNNPTGCYVGPSDVAELLDAAPDALFVVDEAYAPFLTGPIGSLPEDGLRAFLPFLETGRVLLLRSMTKDGALAGLRLGYALAPAPVIAALGAAKPPWSVNRAALAAGLASLAGEDHWRHSHATAARGVAYLQTALRELGLHVYATRANFFLTEVGDALAVREALLRRGLVVRDCTSFGLPSMIRIAARPIADCGRLVAALSQCLPRQ